MIPKRVLISTLLLALALSACRTDSTSSRRLDEQAARIEALESQVAGLDEALANFQSESQMQAEAATEEAQHAAEEQHASHEASAFEVALAQYVMDTAGFHGIDEALNAGAPIDPAYLSTVNRLRRVLSNTGWPEALQEAAQDLLDQLAAFAEALEADDAQAAAPLAAAVHEAQHGLSHDIDAWLGGEGAEHQHDE